MRECTHQSRKTTLTPNLKHYGREDCAICGAFLRWIPKPETIARNAENALKLALLRRKHDSLSEWERGFLLSMEKQGRNFSPKQQERLDILAKEHGYGTTPENS